MIEKTLAADERIVIAFPLYWVAYLDKAILGFFFVVTAVASFSVKDGAPLGWVCLFVLLIIGVKALRMAMIEQVCTNKRVIWKSGIIAVSTGELKLEQIESVSFTQDIMGRIFGYGKIVFTGTGSSKLGLVYIKNVVETKRKIEETISSLTGK